MGRTENISTKGESLNMTSNVERSHWDLEQLTHQDIINEGKKFYWFSSNIALYYNKTFHEVDCMADLSC